MPTRAPARGPSAPDGAPGGSSCLTNLTNCGTALGALQASYGLRADHARGRRLALPLPLVSDYVCDGEMVPEERRHSRTLFTPKLRGVNLGGWMVLVPWVTPSLFYQFEDQPQQRVAMDMLSFCRVLGPKEGNRQLREHWRHWVTDDDLAKLASQGINTLRVPVGDWMWEPYEPYAGCTNGSVSELKRVLRMAAKHHLRVLIDLHGAHTHARARTRARLAAAWPQPGTRPDRLGHWRWRWPRVYQRRKCGLDVPNVKPMERALLAARYDSLPGRLPHLTSLLQCTPTGLSAPCLCARSPKRPRRSRSIHRHQRAVLTPCRRVARRFLSLWAGVKRSQNGFDHSGHTMNVSWDKEGQHFAHWPIRSAGWQGAFDPQTFRYTAISWDNIRSTVSLLQTIALSLRSYPAVLGLEALNEPWQFTPLDVLKAFYWDAYWAVRAAAPAWLFVVQDSFRLEEWAGFMKGCPAAALDTHVYQAWFDIRSQVGSLSLSPVLRRAASLTAARL